MFCSLKYMGSLMAVATKIMIDLLKNRGDMKRFIITHAFADYVIVELPHFRDVRITMAEHSFSKLVSNHLSLPEEDPIKIMRHCNLITGIVMYLIRAKRSCLC
ncbi:hypothetical protein P8452_21745 [Trifolium repens]|nr:hypothetical protein P8452_21745 [Trifolium repens]